MYRNPSSVLEIRQLKNRSRTFQPPTTKQHPYYFSPVPQEGINRNFEQLRYIKYQPFIGRDSIATIQECASFVEADKHWKTQRRYDSRFLIHPDECIMHEGKYVLVFEGIIREFLFWVDEHAKGIVTDAVMLDILMKTAKNLKYLSTVNRPHGNLRRGIGITPDLKVFFFNLGDDNRHGYQHDVQALHEFLRVIEEKLGNSDIKSHVTRWKSFLSTSCLNLTAESSPNLLSHIYPLYNDSHVKLVFNYPTSWDVKDKLRFLANMDALCTDKTHGSNNKLIKDAAFVKSLATHYADWPSKVTGGVSALNEVYKSGLHKGNFTRQQGTTSAMVVCEASIVIFAHDCVKHYCERVQDYNNKKNKKDPRMREHTSSEILAELCTVYPDLIENIYEAFHLALASGYHHHELSVAQILT